MFQIIFRVAIIIFVLKNCNIFDVQLELPEAAVKLYCVVLFCVKCKNKPMDCKVQSCFDKVSCAGLYRLVRIMVKDIAIGATDLGFNSRSAYFRMVLQKKIGLDRNASK